MSESVKQVTSQQVTIQGDRLWRRIEALSRFTDPAKPWTRRAFDEQFSKGRNWLKEEFQAAGLAVAVDAGGNLVGRLAGARPGLGALVAGSHSDTVPSGGRFDGMLGLLAALEVAQCLQEHKIQLNHPLEVVDFLAEEPSDFGLSCIGSRSWAGMLTESDLARTLPSATTLASSIDRVGGDSSRLGQAQRSVGSLAAYVELHIEQGVVLAQKQTEIGVVSGIVGIRRFAVTVEGRANHAGTTPMLLRRDALAGAAEFLLAVEGLAKRRDSADAYLVATVGKLSVEPNAINAVPGSVHMILEIRSTDQAALEAYEQALWQRSQQALGARGLSHKIVPLSQTTPTACSAWVQDAIEQAARGMGYISARLPSGAGHDCVFLAHIAPVGMIFVPCGDGRSHAPEEWAAPQDCTQGAQVLAQTLLLLDEWGTPATRVTASQPSPA